MALLLGLTACFSARARAEFAVVSNTSSLNLRAGPGYEYDILSASARNEWVSIHATENGWSHVTVVRTGQTGYMVDAYLQRGTGGAADTGVVANQSSTAFLNLREYPSYSAKVLGIYYNGATCRILGYENGWYFVEIDGLTGYFRHEYVKTGSGASARVAAANGKPVNLRTGPSMGYPAAGTVPNGEQVSVLLKGSGFWQISYHGLTGYMSSAFLSDRQSAPASNGYLIVTGVGTGKVNLRVQPSMTAKVIAQYASGTRLEVLEGGLTWCKVCATATGLTGYVMTRFTTVYGLPGTPVKTVSNGRSYVNLRASPSASGGKVLRRVQSGDQVTILVPGDEWCQVRCGDTEGYMMTCFLK